MQDQSDRQPEQASAAERFARAARAAQQLCDVLWESLHEELRDPDAGRVKEISQRLLEVSSTIAMLASVPSDPVGDRRAPTASPPPEPSRLGPSRPEPPPTETPRPTQRAAPDLRLAPHSPAESPPSPEEGQERLATHEPPLPFERSSPPDSDSHPDPGGTEPDAPVASQPIPTRAGDYMFTRLVDEHGTSTPVAAEQPASPPEIEIRDVRREEGPSAWVSSVGRLLRRHSEDGLPFAVLLVEIVDVARLERSSTPHDMHGLVAKVEDALGRGMRTSDHLSRETLGRYWLVAPETNGTGARMLAERLARLVRTSASHRGTPLEVAIGIAVCPEDGTEAPALAARADLGVYAARATGRSVAHSDPPGS